MRDGMSVVGMARMDEVSHDVSLHMPRDDSDSRGNGGGGGGGGGGDSSVEQRPRLH